MKLLLVRHGEAVDREDVAAEELRHLTAKGRERCRETAELLAREGVRVDAILSSPLARAVQTAEILAHGLGFTGEVAVRRELEPGFGPEALPALLAELRGHRTVALVGHEPGLGETATRLLGAEPPVALKKGAVLAVKVDPDDPLRGKFLWIACNGRKKERLPEFPGL